MQETGVALGALGVLSSLALGSIWINKYLLKRTDKWQTEQNETQKESNRTLAAVASSTGELATAVIALRESLQRREQREYEFHNEVIQALKSLDMKADRNLTAITEFAVKELHVGTQVVGHEVVKRKQEL